MKYTLLTAFFIFNFLKANCQLSLDDSLVLNKMLNEITSKNEYVIISNPTEVIWKPIDDKLSEEITAWKTKEKQCTVKLTQNDKAQLQEQVIKNKSFIWTDGLFNNASVIDTDSMWSFLKVKNSEHRKLLNDALINKDSIFIKNNKQWYYWAISFTRPIYFENGNACIVSFYAFCDISSGWHQAAVYRKNMSGWYKCLTLQQGDY